MASEYVVKLRNLSLPKKAADHRVMEQSGDNRYLLKFVLVSSLSFFIGTVHGVLQMIPVIRTWLDSIGSPYGGPGHMIDPLAHAHINLIGGVMILSMAITYYLLPKFSNTPLYSRRLVEHSFWWTTIGALCFYLVLMIFGVIEGVLLLDKSPELDHVQQIYRYVVAVSASIMGIGLWIYLTNIILTIKNIYKRP
jgi:cbb3-type cytochrome oxidase subunit 1